MSHRLFLGVSILGVALGGGCLIPAIVQWLEQSVFARQHYLVAAIGLGLVLAGVGILVSGVCRSHRANMSIPAPVRAALAANILFLGFCALETSDGLLRQNGRIVYWTTFLAPPALIVLYGLVMAHSWSWWVARTLAALSALWFLGFIALIPFANLRTDAGPVPWEGRLYMVAVSLAFASISAYAFHSLGSAAARKYFRRADQN